MGIFKRFAHDGPPSPLSTSSSSSPETKPQKLTTPPSSQGLYSVIKSRTFPISRPEKSQITPMQPPTPPDTPTEEHERRLARAKTPPVSMHKGLVQWTALTPKDEYESLSMERREAALERINKLRASLGLPEKNLDKTLRSPKIRSEPEKEFDEILRCISPIESL